MSIVVAEKGRPRVEVEFLSLDSADHYLISQVSSGCLEIVNSIFNISLTNIGNGWLDVAKTAGISVNLNKLKPEEAKQLEEIIEHLNTAAEYVHILSSGKVKGPDGSVLNVRYTSYSLTQLAAEQCWKKLESNKEKFESFVARAEESRALVIVNKVQRVDPSAKANFAEDADVKHQTDTGGRVARPASKVSTRFNSPDRNKKTNSTVERFAKGLRAIFSTVTAPITFTLRLVGTGLDNAIALIMKPYEARKESKRKAIGVLRANQDRSIFYGENSFGALSNAGAGEKKGIGNTNNKTLPYGGSSESFVDEEMSASIRYARLVYCGRIIEASDRFRRSVSGHTVYVPDSHERKRLIRLDIFLEQERKRRPNENLPLLEDLYPISSVPAITSNDCDSDIEYDIISEGTVLLPHCSQRFKVSALTFYDKSGQAIQGSTNGLEDIRECIFGGLLVFAPIGATRVRVQSLEAARTIEPELTEKLRNLLPPIPYYRDEVSEAMIAGLKILGEDNGLVELFLLHQVQQNYLHSNSPPYSSFIRQSGKFLVEAVTGLGVANIDTASCAYSLMLREFAPALVVQGMQASNADQMISKPSYVMTSYVDGETIKVFCPLLHFKGEAPLPNASLGELSEIFDIERFITSNAVHNAAVALRALSARPVKNEQKTALQRQSSLKMDRAGSSGSFSAEAFATSFAADPEVILSQLDSPCGILDDLSSNKPKHQTMLKALNYIGFIGSLERKLKTGFKEGDLSNAYRFLEGTKIASLNAEEISILPVQLRERVSIDPWEMALEYTLRSLEQKTFQSKSNSIDWIIRSLTPIEGIVNFQSDSNSQLSMPKFLAKRFYELASNHNVLNNFSQTQLKQFTRLVFGEVAISNLAEYGYLATSSGYYRNKSDTAQMLNVHAGIFNYSESRGVIWTESESRELAFFVAVSSAESPDSLKLKLTEVFDKLLSKSPAEHITQLCLVDPEREGPKICREFLCFAKSKSTRFSWEKPHRNKIDYHCKLSLALAEHLTNLDPIKSIGSHLGALIEIVGSKENLMSAAKLRLEEHYRNIIGTNLADKIDINFPDEIRYPASYFKSLHEQGIATRLAENLSCLVSVGGLEAEFIEKVWPRLDEVSVGKAVFSNFVISGTSQDGSERVAYNRKSIASLELLDSLSDLILESDSLNILRLNLPKPACGSFAEEVDRQLRNIITNPNSASPEYRQIIVDSVEGSQTSSEKEVRLFNYLRRRIINNLQKVVKADQLLFAAIVFDRKLFCNSDFSRDEKLNIQARLSSRLLAHAAPIRINKQVVLDILESEIPRFSSFGILDQHYLKLEDISAAALVFAVLLRDVFSAESSNDRIGLKKPIDQLLAESNFIRANISSAFHIASEIEQPAGQGLVSVFHCLYDSARAKADPIDRQTIADIFSAASRKAELAIDRIGKNPVQVLAKFLQSRTGSLNPVDSGGIVNSWREYAAGDDIRMLDLKLLARLDKKMIKIKKEKEEHRVHIFVDADWLVASVDFKEESHANLAELLLLLNLHERAKIPTNLYLTGHVIAKSWIDICGDKKIPLIDKQDQIAELVAFARSVSVISNELRDLNGYLFIPKNCPFIAGQVVPKRGERVVIVLPKKLVSANASGISALKSRGALVSLYRNAVF